MPGNIQLAEIAVQCKEMTDNEAMLTGKLVDMNNIKIINVNGACDNPELPAAVQSNQILMENAANPMHNIYIKHVPEYFTFAQSMPVVLQSTQPAADQAKEKSHSPQTVYNIKRSLKSAAVPEKKLQSITSKQTQMSSSINKKQDECNSRGWHWRSCDLEVPGLTGLTRSNRSRNKRSCMKAAPTSDVRQFRRITGLSVSSFFREAIVKILRKYKNGLVLNVLWDYVVKENDILKSMDWGFLMILRKRFSNVLCRESYFIQFKRMCNNRAITLWKVDLVKWKKEMTNKATKLKIESNSKSKTNQNSVGKNTGSDSQDYNEPITMDQNSSNSIKVDYMLDIDLTPEVVSYGSSSIISKENAIESISQQKCRSSPAIRQECHSSPAVRQECRSSPAVRQECRSSPAAEMNFEQVSVVPKDKESLVAEKITSSDPIGFTHECPICDQTFPSNENLGAHMSVHSKKQKIFKDSSLHSENPSAISPSVDTVPTVSSSNDTQNTNINQSGEMLKRAMECLPVSLFSGQAPIIFLGNVYFNSNSSASTNK